MKPLLALPISLKELLNATKSDLIRMGDDLDGRFESLDVKVDKLSEGVDDIYDDVVRLKRVA